MRHYSIAVARARVESSNADTSLGKFWLIGEPLLFIAVYGTIFGIILDADRGVDNFIGFLASGQLLFRHNSQAMQEAGNAMNAFGPQIQAMAVPRALFPITSVATTFFTQLPSFFVMFVVLILTGETPSPAWIFIIVVVAGQVLLNAGVGMILSRAIAHLPDLSNVLTHIFRSLLYASGVVFPIQTFLERRENGDLLIKLLTILNPIYCYIELGRWALFGIRPPHAGLTIASTTAWSIGTLVVGMWWLRRAELRYGFGQIRNAP